MVIQNPSQALAFYWQFLKRFGEECYRTWRSEIAIAVAVTIITYFLTRQDKDAWEITTAALEANLILFLGFVIFHLVRTPYLLHHERTNPQLVGQTIVHWIFGLLGSALLAVIVMAASYRTAKPWVFQLPNITVMAPAPPTIPQAPSQSTTYLSRGESSGKPPQLTVPSQSRLPAIAAHPPIQSTLQPNPQVSQSAVPQTQLERLIQTDRNLTAGDRDRLSNAIFDYAQFLDQGMSLGYKVSTEFGKIAQDRSNGSLAKNFDDHIKSLRDIGASGWIYSKNFTQIRDKWKYYSDQTDYIFGDNPDKFGPDTLINTAVGFADYLGFWSKITNKDQKDVLTLVAIQQDDYTQSLTHFFHWVQECQQRLNQVKQSIQPNGVVQPNQSPTIAPAAAFLTTD